MCDYISIYDEDYKCPHPDYGPGKDGEKTFCIFHNDREDKDVEKFYKGFKKLYKSVKHDFRGFIFPEGFSFKKLKKENATLEFVNAVFSEARFFKPVDFSDVYFFSEFGTFFTGAEFSGKGHTDFRGAVFSGKGRINFNGVVFSGDGGTYFSGAEFSGNKGTEFKNVKFSSMGGTDFRGVEFSGEGFTSFRKTVFSGEGGANFKKTKFSCESGTDFRDAKFLCEDRTNFTGARFLCKGRTDFRGAEFSSEGGTFFSGARFSGEGKTYFSRANFSCKGGIYFSWVKFSSEGGTLFTGANFSCQGKKDFRGAEFSSEGGIFFSEVNFSGRDATDFRGAVFSGKGRTYFRDSNFSSVGGTHFTGSKFSSKKGTDFKNAVLSCKGKIDFRNTRFSDQWEILFENTDFAKKTKIDFIHLAVENPSKIIFDKVDLSNVRFIDTDIRHFNFKEVYWRNQKELSEKTKKEKSKISDIIKEYLKSDIKAIYKKVKKYIEGIFLRIMVYDEVLQRGFNGKNKDGEENHYKVQQLYNQLRLNYEDSGRYYEAGDFFVSAMEMRRKGRRERWVIRKVLTLYKLISLYGERPVRAFLWLVLLPFLFSLIYLLSGLEVSGKKGNDIVNYDLVLTLRNFGFTFFHDLVHAFKYSLSVITLKKLETNNINPTDATFFISIFELIFGAILLSLFILAMNRKFRRTKD